MSGRLIGEVLYAPILASGSGTIIAGTAGSKIRVLSCFLGSTAAINVQFRGGSTSPADDLSGHIPLPINGQLVLPFNEFGWFTAGAGADLVLELSAASVIGGSITYVLVP